MNECELLSRLHNWYIVQYFECDSQLPMRVINGVPPHHPLYLPQQRYPILHI